MKMGLTDFNVRVPGEFNSVHELEDVVVGLSDGETIYLRDIATIQDTFRDVTQEVRINGQRGAALIVQKQTDANTVTVAQNRSEEHTSELQSRGHHVCQLLF